MAAQSFSSTSAEISTAARFRSPSVLDKHTHPQPFFFYLCEALHGHTHPLTVTLTIPTNQPPDLHTDLNPSLTTALKPSLFPQTGIGRWEDQPECPWKTTPKNVLILIVE